MNKNLIIVLVICLGIVSGLFGVFSTSVSPNGHPYNPTFQQCEDEEYICTPVPTQLEVGSLITGPSINSYIVFNPGTIHFSINRMEIMYQNISVMIDNT